jgi:hypothetical protein
LTSALDGDTEVSWADAPTTMTGTSQQGGTDERQDLDGLLAEISALLTRLESRSAVDTSAVDAELGRLAARLRESEQRLSERRPLRFRRK